LKQTIGVKILGICLLVISVFTVLNIYSYQKFQQVTIGYRDVIERNAALIFKVYSADIELSRQAALLQQYVNSGNDQHRRDFEESKVNMEAVFASLDRDLITAEGKAGLAGVRQVVDSWHLSAMQAIKQRSQNPAAAVVASPIDPLKMVKAAEQEIDAFQRFLRSRMHQRTEENSRVMETTQTFIIAANAIVIVLGIGLSLWLWRSISQPLGGINRMARSIAGGDLREKSVLYTHKDELGEIVHAITAMNQNLRKLVSQVMESAEKVSAACGEFRLAADGSAEAAGHITENMTEVAERAEAIFKEADAVRQQMEAVTLKIEQVAEHASHAAEVARKTTGSSQAGQQAIERAIEQMGSIRESTDNIGQAAEKLAAGTIRIGEFVSIINGIAEQTHLLALNAAIEAARAGDAGKGFAVVAQEVNKLAAESAKSAKDVHGMIVSNRRDLEAVVAYIRTGREGVAAGIEMVETAGKEFVSIAQGVTQVSQNMQEISLAVDDLATSGQNIMSAVKRVEEKSGETAGRTQAISAAVQQQAASLQQMAGSGRSLDGLAQNMQDVVKKFTI
jgi:methyl-accepting chemotaxis protein